MNSREHQDNHTGQYHRKRNSDNIYHHNNYNYGPIKQLSKQQFIQANCQFVVIDDRRGYSFGKHLKNSDLIVPWEYIEQVRFRQVGCTEIICPICLSSPNAAQITRCGHIFCFSCVLHYLGVSDDKKCPVCFWPLKRDDLKSVVSILKPSVTVGDEISLRLMHRRRGRMIAEPYGSLPDFDLTSDLSAENTSANLIFADPKAVAEQVALKEKEELSWRYKENEESEICFVEEAMEILNKRLEKLEEKAKILIPTPHPDIVRLIYGTSISEPTKDYLFYQCNSEHVYLNPFCTKILSHEFGKLEDCPKEVKGKIIGLECISMNHACRKRFKYLEHLPLSCEFRLVEIDLRHLISSSTYEHFKDQIIARENERKRRLREEQKRDKIIEVQQNRRIYGIMPTLNISLDSREQFPSVSGYSDPPKPRDSATNENDHSENSAVRYPGVSSGVGAAEQLAETRDDIDNNTPRPMSSFDAIQKQEEQEALVNSGNDRGTSSWATRSKAPNQPSFAKLLIDAREKIWTTNVKEQKNPPSLQQSPSQQNSATGEIVEDQVRPPPCEFTISDFLEQNVTFSKKSRKPKRQTKKG